LLAVAAAFMALFAEGQASVLTQHNDIGRTGQNLNETILNTANVNVRQFGRLFNLPVLGQVYAQPLYVPNVTINGKLHNVLIVATEQDRVYAFDADYQAVPLWEANLVDMAHGASPGEGPVPALSDIGCTDLHPFVGVSSTPAIDPVAGTIYVEAKSVTGPNYIHRLHALDLTTGNEKSPGPAVITATVDGTGDGSNNGQLTFDGLNQHNRPGLLLQNGSILIGYASHCDYSPYHGWIFSYDAATLAQQSVFVTTPNGGLGGFWMSGAGIAADTDGRIYPASGNGDFDTTNVPATELGDTIMKLGTTGGKLSLQDYFTPSDQSCLASNDTDLGSGGVLVLPDQPGPHPHILVEAGKEGAIYVVNRDQMTANNNHFENSNNCTTHDPQILEESASGAIGGMWSMPAYWNNTLYFWGMGDVLRSIPVVNGLPNLNQVTTNSTNIQYPGSTPSISSNGNVAGTGILWAIDSSQYGSPGPGPGPAILYAFDATNISNELWDSAQAPGNRDMAGNAVKFAVPTVVNGKVYVGTSDGVTVYGLFPVVPAPVFNPGPGLYASAQKVTITDTTRRATIYYAINGKPSTSSTQYTGPITVSATETLRAMATAPTSIQSSLTTAAYTIRIPAVTLSASKVAFGDRRLGAVSGAESVTLTNTGQVTLSLSISITGTDAGSYSETNSCGASVAAGSSCVITVSCKPIAAGPLTASLRIGYNAAGSPIGVALTGTGIGPIVSLSRSRLAFAATPAGKAAATQTFTLTNKGNSTLGLAGTAPGRGIAITGNGAGSFTQTNDCGSSVKANAACTISVIFKPMTTGALAAEVTIADNAANSPQAVKLIGTGK
jgi:hypothetical protein